MHRAGGECSIEVKQSSKSASTTPAAASRMRPPSNEGHNGRFSPGANSNSRWVTLCRLGELLHSAVRPLLQ